MFHTLYHNAKGIVEEYKTPAFEKDLVQAIRNTFNFFDFFVLWDTNQTELGGSAEYYIYYYI